MGAYKDKNGTWFASARYKNWAGETKRKMKRGFSTKREALEWEQQFIAQNNGNLEMTLKTFYELYKNNLQNRLRKNTWVMKDSIVQQKILPYLGDKRICDIKPIDVLHWQNTIMDFRDENGMPYSPVYLKTIHNQELICKGWFLPPNTYDCGSFVVNGTAVIGKKLNHLNYS